MNDDIRGLAAMRREKAAKIRAKGVDPYPHLFEPTCLSKELLEKMGGDEARRGERGGDAHRRTHDVAQADGQKRLRSSAGRRWTDTDLCAAKHGRRRCLRTISKRYST